MNCQRIRQEIKAYIDGELGPVARWRVSSHIARCPECQKEMGIMTDLTRKVSSPSDIPAPGGLREKVMERVDSAPDPDHAIDNLGTGRAYAWGAAAVVVIGIAATALIMPIFSRAKNAANYTAARERPQVAHKMSPEAKRSGAAGPVPSIPGGVQPIIIKTADLTLQVTDFRIANDSAISIAKSVGGYVTDSSTEAADRVPTSGTLTLRVPVDSFERVIERLGKLGTVKSKGLNGRDVTGEVVDLESRIRNKRAEERQYLEIMNRANRVSDVVAVSQELYRVRGEIEQAEGRLKYLKSAAAMATINVTLAEKPEPKPAPESSIKRNFTNAVASLAVVGNALLALVIWLAVFSPFWALPIGAVVYARRMQVRGLEG